MIGMQLTVRLILDISWGGMFSLQNFNFNRPEREERRTGEEVYFEGSKKNELTELKNYLKRIVSDPDKAYYRKEAIKKIISYTTQGYDTSRIYPEIVLASATRDLVEKKLIYLYLGIYSSSNADYARMAINTFLKDATSPNPNFRAFALRNLSNLRFKGRQQYTLPVLTSSLDDMSPLVRKSAVMGLTKLIVEKNRTLETPTRDEELLNRFYAMIRDPDCSLVCTVIEAINEIEEEGIAMSKKLAHYLLGSIGSFSETQLPVVLAHLELYEPKTKEEVVHTLTVLEPKLKSSSPAVALGISKIYLKMGELRPALLPDVLKVLRGALCSLVHLETPQVEYVVLRHIEYVISAHGPEAWGERFKLFLIGGPEPTYLKVAKIRILERLIQAGNSGDIINELVEYLQEEDVSEETARVLNGHLLRAQEQQAKFILKNIIRAVDGSRRAYLCNNVLPLVKNYLRLYPRDFQMLAGVFYTLVEHASTEEAKCAMVEIIGDFGEQVEDAIELLAWNHNEISDRLKVCLLRASAKLFLKRPQEMHSLLSSLLRSVLTDDHTELHVKDYAAYLYRALSSDIQAFRESFLQPRAQTALRSLPHQRFEFNSLEVMYGKGMDKWMLERTKYIEVEAEELVEFEGPPEEEEASRAEVLVDIETRFKSLEAEDFDVSYSMSPEDFEQKWEEYDVGSSITRVVVNTDLLSEENLEELFKMWNIQVLASVDTEEEIKLYNYCRVQSEGGDLGTACMEFTVQKLPETLTLMIKCDDEELAGFISKYIEDFLKTNEII